MIINQWVPAAHRGDAIGDSARRVRDSCCAPGARLRHLRADDRRRPSRRRPAVRRPGGAARRRDDLPLRAALADDRGASRTLTARRVLQYHNITPASFFAPYDAGAVPARGAGPRRSWRRSRGQRRSRARRLGVQPAGARGARLRADRRDADRGQHRRASPAAPPRPALEKILGDGLINILFVGRIAPNKKIEDHIRLAEIYKRYVDSHYRFIFVGRYRRRAALLRARSAR